MTRLRARLTLSLAGVVAFVLGASSVEASISRDASRPAFSSTTVSDSFAAVPQLALPSLTQQLKAIDERVSVASECVALCRLAASVDAAPLGYVWGRPTPQGVKFLYDDTSLLAEYDTNGNEVAKYDYGADRLIRLTRTDEGTRYMTFDGLGSVTGLTNLSGEVTAAYHLDAWGNYRFTAELAPSKNRFGFTGHYWDNEAGLYYAKARYYDPFTARFTQSDSFLGSIDDPPSLHRYFYANGNPTMYVDPSGHLVQGAVGVGVGALFGLGINAVHQGLSIYEGGKKDWSWSEFAEAGVTGAFIGGVAAYNPVAAARMGLLLSAYGVSSGVEEIKEGHTLTGVFDIGVSLLGANASRRVLAAQPTAGAHSGPSVERLPGLAQGPFEAPDLVPSPISTTLPGGVRISTNTSSTSAQISIPMGSSRVSMSLRVSPSEASRLSVSFQNPPAKAGSPSQLSAGQAWEKAELASLGKAKNTGVWRPTPEDIESAAFKVIVGRAKYTAGGRPVGTTVDIAETGGSIEIKGGTKMMESSYQLRLQTYRALRTDTPLMIRTTRPINPTFSDWLTRWGVQTETLPPRKP